MIKTIRRSMSTLTQFKTNIYGEKDGKKASFFHDIPLKEEEFKDNVYNMVVEIPRFTNVKAEISTKEPFNPIKLDQKNGKVRFVKNRFPYKGYIWNYGALPQTWEDPNIINEDTKAKGDNDPLDVLEIGDLTGYPGQIKQVKVLGILAMLDEGETDWKLLTIDVNDHKSKLVNDIEDIDAHFPGLLNATVDWFRYYKVPDSKPVNEFAFDGKFQNVLFAKKIIEETHSFWKKLVKEGSTKLETTNATLTGTTNFKPSTQVDKILNYEDAELPTHVDEFHFIPSKL